jgi:hypothetical protein
MNYKIKWTQPYTQWEGDRIIRELEQRKADLIERVIDHENFDFAEAREVLARIMAR